MVSLPSLRYALLGALLFLAVAATSVSASDQQLTVQVGSQQRTCVLHLPPAYDGKRLLPLVITFHGSGNTGAGMEAKMDLDQIADKEGFITAYPDGISGKNHGWNAIFGKASGDLGAQMNDVDDVGFTRSLIDLLHNSYHTDPLRVYVCGHSAGAYMAYRAAIDLADRIAAAGVCNGSLGIRLADGKPSLDGIPKPVAPISLIHICGKKDDMVKFEGTRTPRVVTLSVPDCVQHFVKANGCRTPGKEVRGAHGVTRTLYSGGIAGTEVELVTLENGGHSWYLAQSGLSASQEVWDFFSKHPKSANAALGSPANGLKN